MGPPPCNLEKELLGADKPAVVATDAPSASARGGVTLKASRSFSLLLFVVIVLVVMIKYVSCYRFLLCANPSLKPSSMAVITSE